MNSYGIYLIKNEINNKGYIGSSISGFKNRFIQHRSSFKNNRHSKHIQFAYNKYGEENFNYLIIESMSKKNAIKEMNKNELINIVLKDNVFKEIRDLYISHIEKEDKIYFIHFRETYWIQKLKTSNRKYGYNTQPIGASSFGAKFKVSPEKIRKFENHPMYGKKHTEQTKEVIRKKCSEKAKKISLKDCLIIKNLLIKYEFYKIPVSQKIQNVYNDINKIISTRVIASIRDGKHWSSYDLKGGIKNWLQEEL